LTVIIGLASGGVKEEPGVTNQANVMDLTPIGKDKYIETLSSQRKPWHSNELIMGTSVNVVPVTNYDGRRIGNGLPGPVFSKLSALMEKDIRENKDLLTALDWQKENF
jgi:hypothetical protein